MWGFSKIWGLVHKFLPIIEQLISKLGPIGQAIAAALAFADGTITALSQGQSIGQALLKGLQSCAAEVICSFTGGALGNVINKMSTALQGAISTVMGQVTDSALPEVMKGVINTALKGVAREIANPMFIRNMVSQIVMNPAVLTDDQAFAQAMLQTVTTEEVMRAWPKISGALDKTLHGQLGNAYANTVSDYKPVIMDTFTPPKMPADFINPSSPVGAGNFGFGSAPPMSLARMTGTYAA